MPLVELVDLFPTLCSAAGIHMPENGQIREQLSRQLKRGWRFAVPDQSTCSVF